MKKLITAIMIFAFSMPAVYALGGINLGVFGGLSVPNDNIADVVKTAKNTPNTTNFLIGSLSSGFHMGAKIKLALADKIDFVGSIAWHHFPETDNRLQIAAQSGLVPAQTALITTKTDIIPVTVGLNYSLLSFKLIGIHAAGDLSYNYFTNSIGLDKVPEAYKSALSLSKDGGRVGAGIGLGVVVNAIILKFDIVTKYNFSNIIGKEDGESARNYLSCSLGIYL